MARPFQIALESSDLEGAVGESENSELTVSDVIEDEAASDEAAEIQEDINRDSDALEELTEEVGVLADQVEKNEEKLENPEEVVAADVVVSEESLRDSMVRVGYTDGLSDRISFASESTYESLKLNPARHLSISNEGVKDFIAKMVSTVKTLVIRIINYSKKLFAKILFKFGNYEKKYANLSIKNISQDTLKANLAKLEDKPDFLKKCFETHPLYCLGGGEAKAVFEPKTVSEVMAKFEDISKDIIQTEISGAKKEQKDMDKAAQGSSSGGFFSGLASSVYNKIKSLCSLKKTSPIGKISESAAKYADPQINNEVEWAKGDSSLMFTAIGKKFYYLRFDDAAGTKIIDNIDVVKPQNDSEVEGRIPTFAEYFATTENQLKNRKLVFDAYDKNQNEYLKALKQLESNQKAKDATAAKGLKIAVNAMKAGASQLNLLLVKGFIDNIKRTAQLANIISNELEGDGENKENKENKEIKSIGNNSNSGTGNDGGVIDAEITEA